MNLKILQLKFHILNYRPLGLVGKAKSRVQSHDSDGVGSIPATPLRKLSALLIISINKILFFKSLTRNSIESIPLIGTLRNIGKMQVEKISGKIESYCEAAAVSALIL